MFGLGKSRSRFGQYLDNNKISQESVVKTSGLSRNAVSRLCDGDRNDEKLYVESKFKVVSALRKMGYDVRTEDFW
jgi:predicted XRE-type DNA-binding protein